MSSKNVPSEVVSVDEQAFEKADEAAVDEDGFEVVDETPEFQATVQMEVQAKVDANHPDGMVDTSEERIYGATLEQEERIRAREAELERISAQAEMGTQEGREKRTRDIAAKRSAERRAEFQKRAASVDPWTDPERDDPRAELTQEQLAAVNKQSMRLAEKLDGWSRAAIGRRLGEAVVSGKDLTSAVVGVFKGVADGAGTGGSHRDARGRQSQRGEHRRYCDAVVGAVKFSHFPSGTYRRRKWTDKVHQLGCERPTLD